MRTRALGQRLALGAAALLVAACGSSTAPTASPTATQPPATTAPSTGGGSPSAAPSAGSDSIDLFNTGYAPADGPDGGTAIIGDWQEATQFNPFYLTQVTEANVAAATWAS